LTLSERSEFSSSRQLRGAQGIRQGRTSEWLSFLLVHFLWTSKENEHKKTTVVFIRHKKNRKAKGHAVLSGI